MKGFLLSAGLGTRLRPLTDTTPKCLLPIDGQPMLDLWLDRFAQAGVDEVLVNLHHLAQVVRLHLAERVAPPVVRAVYEPDLLGSAGTLAANRAWVSGERVVLVCNVDNLTDFNLRSLIDAHEEGGAVATLAVFHADRPQECGIVEIDDAGRMIGFVEKPANPATNLANAGIYAFAPSVLGEIEGTPPVDIGYHLLPRLVGRARTVRIEGYFRDIGTIDAYHRAQREWAVRTP